MVWNQVERFGEVKENDINYLMVLDKVLPLLMTMSVGHALREVLRKGLCHLLVNWGQTMFRQHAGDARTSGGVTGRMSKECLRIPPEGVSQSFLVSGTVPSDQAS